MAAPARDRTSELRRAVLSAWETLRRQRRASSSKGVVAGGDLAAAETEYEALTRRYAAARITGGLGPDPEVLDGERFAAVLFEMAEPGRFAKLVPKTRTSCLLRETMTAMLASGSDLAKLLKTLSAPSAFRDAFNQETPLRHLIRTWAEAALPDPFLSRRLGKVSKHKADFERAVDDAALLLRGLRAKTESADRPPKNGEPPNGGLAVERGPDGKLNVVATTPWEALVRSFPDDVDELYASVAAAELAAGQIEHAANEINAELGRFFSELVPRYFGLLSRLPRKKRNERTGGVRLSPGLAIRLVEAIQTTDFVADPASPLGFERKSLPRRFRLLATQRGCRRVRDILAGRRKQDDTTVVVRHAAPVEPQEP